MPGAGPCKHVASASAPGAHAPWDARCRPLHEALDHALADGVLQHEIAAPTRTRRKVVHKAVRLRRALPHVLAEGLAKRRPQVERATRDLLPFEPEGPLLLAVGIGELRGGAAVARDGVETEAQQEPA